jgi:hypothetical protein
MAKPFVVAGWGDSEEYSNAILARGSKQNNLRGWEPAPVISASPAQPVGVERTLRTVSENPIHSGSLPPSDLWMGQSHASGVHAPPAGWAAGNSGTRRGTSQDSVADALPHRTIVRTDWGIRTLNPPSVSD